MSLFLYTSLIFQVMAARHLLKSGRGLASPFVEVEVVGIEHDNNKNKTNIISELLINFELD